MAEAGAMVPAVPVVGLDLPRPPVPYDQQCEEFRICLVDVVQMTVAQQVTRLATNGVLTAEDVAMLDAQTLMAIPLKATSAMIKMRLKTLVKTWVDAAFDAVVGLPMGMLDIQEFTDIVCKAQKRILSRKSGVL